MFWGLGLFFLPRHLWITTVVLVYPNRTRPICHVNQSINSIPNFPSLYLQQGVGFCDLSPTWPRYRRSARGCASALMDCVSRAIATTTRRRHLQQHNSLRRREVIAKVNSFTSDRAACACQITYGPSHRPSFVIPVASDMVSWVTRSSPKIPLIAIISLQF